MISPNTASFIHLQPSKQKNTYKKTSHAPEFVSHLRDELFFSVLKYVTTSPDYQIANDIERLKQNYVAWASRRSSKLLFGYCLVTSLEFIFEYLLVHRKIDPYAIYSKEYYQNSSKKIKDMLLTGY